MFRTPVDGFFPAFLRAQKMVRVIEGERKIGSSKREFEFSRVRVTEDKITVNV